MKYDEIKVNTLSEAMYGKKFLKNFASSQEAQGIRFGFEAEMIIPNMGNSSGDIEPVPREDERADDIDDVIAFFGSDGTDNAPRVLRNLRITMENDYREWVSEQWDREEEQAVREYLEKDWDKLQEIKNYLSDELGLSPKEIDDAIYSKAGESYIEAVDSVNEQFEDRLDRALRTKNSDYDEAYDEWEEDSPDETEWFHSQGWRRMSHIYRQYDNIVEWPYDYPPDDSSSETKFAEDDARALAYDLATDLGLVDVTVGSGYHNVTRTEDRWIIEPDGSLESNGDGMPVEIISPPMPLDQGLVKFKEFFEWAKTQNALTGQVYRTGLHIGISLPDVGGKVDYIKLALLLGDEYVSEQFERLGEFYAQNIIFKIRDYIDKYASSSKIDSALDMLKNGLTELAIDSLNINKDYGKYVSIHPKGNYIEFRSPGGDYMDKIDTVLETVQRFAYAMYVANSKDLFKREYLIKLTKLLAPSQVAYYDSSLPQNKVKPTEFISLSDVRELQRQKKTSNIRTIVDPASKQSISLYTRLLRGELSKNEVRDELNKLRTINIRNKELKNPKVKSGMWSVFIKPGPHIDVYAMNNLQAIEKAKNLLLQWKNIPNTEFEVTYLRPLTNYESNWYNSNAFVQSNASDDLRSTSTPTQNASTGQEFTGIWRIINSAGVNIHEFGGIGNSQRDANVFATRFLLSQQLLDPNDEYQVIPVMR